MMRKIRFLDSYICISCDATNFFCALLRNFFRINEGEKNVSRKFSMNEILARFDYKTMSKILNIDVMCSTSICCLLQERKQKHFKDVHRKPNGIFKWLGDKIFTSERTVSRRLQKKIIYGILL